jgi:hypothetical protein
MEMFGFLNDEFGNDLAARIHRFLKESGNSAQLDQELRKMVHAVDQPERLSELCSFGDPATRIA